MLKNRVRLCAALSIITLLTPAIQAADQAHSRDGRFRYTVTESGIRQYRVTHGRSVPLSPPLAETDRETDAVALAPSGRFLYALEGEYAGIDQFRVGKNGALLRLHPFLASAYAHPTDIVFHPSGRFAYVLCSHGAICQYRIERNGQLTPLAPAFLSVSEHGQRDPSHLRFTGHGRATITVSTPEEGPRKIPLIVHGDGTLERTQDRD